MQIIYPQLDGVKINDNRTLPTSLIQSIRKAYEYISQLAGVNSTDAVIIQNTHTNRNTLYPSANQTKGSFYVETDRLEALYIIQDVSAAKQWVLVHGAMQGLLAARPADLTSNDVGFFYVATDALDYRWSGAAWTTLSTVKGGTTLTSTGAIPKVTSTGILGQSALTDSGTIISGTEPLHLDTGASPANSQLSLTANALGSLELLSFAADNQQIFLDAIRSAASLIAASTTAAAIAKTATHLKFRGASGLVVGNVFAFTDWAFMNLATGSFGFGGNTTPGEAVDATGSINASVSYKTAGTKVVGARAAAVTAPTGGATIDSQARTAINDLISRLQGHGLIS